MGILSRVLHHEQPQAPPVECPHAVIVARWDNVEDMGKEERASSFECPVCSKHFSPDEAAEIRSAASARIHETVEVEG